MGIEFLDECMGNILVVSFSGTKVGSVVATKIICFTRWVKFCSNWLIKEKICSKWGFVKVDKSLKWTKRKWVEVERLEDGIAYDLNWRLDFWYRRIEK